MFDSLKKSIAKFTGKVTEDAELKQEPVKAAPLPAPAPVPITPPAKAEPKPAPASRKPEPKAEPVEKFDVIEDDEDDLLDEDLKREIAELEKTPPPPPVAAKPAPTHVPAPAMAKAEAKPAPAVTPVVHAPPTPKPLAPAVTPPPKSAPAPAPAPVARTPPKPVEAPRPQGNKSIQLDKIDDLLWDLELSLLESDVALPVVEDIKETLKQNLQDVRVGSPDEVPAAVEAALRGALLHALSVKPIDFDSWILEKTMAKKPVVIMFVGVNGTGKTTSIGRLAYRLKENGYTSVMAAGDTFRAGAIQQLEKHAEKVGVSFIKTTPGGDPAAVAFDAIEHAKGRMKDVVLLDTAGRMQTNTNLMDEMKKIKRVAKPDMIVFVGDSLAGNDAVEQAVQFDKAVGIDAVILTKVDTDAKGGAALSIAKAVGKPILFLGVGQEYGDIVPYDPQWMVDRIFESA